MKNKVIELSATEATAYWWVETIREKVREIIAHGSDDENELDFANIFIDFSEKDWRNLYLELSKLIIEDINNYVPHGNTYDIDSFNQDTKEGEHNRITEELSQIVKRKVPDIRLACSYLKDSVIYTNMFGACRWYKSCATTNLPTKYNTNYILTGDEEELKFYNTLLATLICLKNIDKSFKSTQQLRIGFCGEYLAINNLKLIEFENILELFHKLFNTLSDRNIILGRSYDDTYYLKIEEMDYAGLEDYIDIGNYYANKILEQSIIIDYKRNRKNFIKTLNKNDN